MGDAERRVVRKYQDAKFACVLAGFVFAFGASCEMPKSVGLLNFALIGGLFVYTARLAPKARQAYLKSRVAEGASRTAAEAEWAKDNDPPGG